MRHAALAGTSPTGVLAWGQVAEWFKAAVLEPKASPQVTKPPRGVSRVFARMGTGGRVV